MLQVLSFVCITMKFLQKIENSNVFNQFVSLHKLIKVYKFCNERWFFIVDKMQFYWSFSIGECCFNLLCIEFFSRVWLVGCFFCRFLENIVLFMLHFTCGIFNHFWSCSCSVQCANTISKIATILWKWQQYNIHKTTVQKKALPNGIMSQKMFRPKAYHENHF